MFQACRLQTRKLYHILRKSNGDGNERTLRHLIHNDFGDGRNRYELNDEEFAHFHHHLICVKCGKVSEFEDDMLETLESIIAKKLNFRTIDHQLKVYGYCSDCQNHMTEAELEKLERMSHHG